MARRYDPNQPRVPAGHSSGGQWTNRAWSPSGDIAERAAREAAGLPPKQSGQYEVIDIAEWGVLQSGKVLASKPNGDGMGGRKGHEWLTPDDEYDGDLDRFKVRGTWGYIRNENTGEKIPIVAFYNFGHWRGRTRGNEISDWATYQNKVLDKISYINEDFYSPTIYISPDAFQYLLFNPREW